MLRRRLSLVFSVVEKSQSLGYMRLTTHPPFRDMHFFIPVGWSEIKIDASWLEIMPTASVRSVLLLYIDISARGIPNGFRKCRVLRLFVTSSE